jgi:hypothetical protein
MTPNKHCRKCLLVLGCWLAGSVFAAVTAAAATNAPAASAPSFGGGNNAATEQDHQRMMDLLHITSIRRGKDGNNTNSPFYANYDEAGANPFPNLPDALVLKSGEKVTTAKMWWKQRRIQNLESALALNR